MDQDVDDVEDVKDFKNFKGIGDVEDVEGIEYYEGAEDIEGVEDVEYVDNYAMNVEEASTSQKAKIRVNVIRGEAHLKCEHCDFRTDLPHVFTRHTNSIKQCEMCFQVFCGRHSVKNFLSHQKWHNSKPKSDNTCAHCNKSFVYASKLKRHIIQSKKCGQFVDLNSIV